MQIWTGQIKELIFLKIKGIFDLNHDVAALILLPAEEKPWEWAGRERRDGGTASFSSGMDFG